tara:strand:- start:701 stop:1105 length:405 start_codon:yes stop_codon:yes gene_type:complete
MQKNNMSGIFSLPENVNNLNFSSNFQYRNYLTKNGSNILTINNNNFIFDQNYNCNYYQKKTPVINNQPFTYTHQNIIEKPYGYTQSDLKSDFMNRRMRQYIKNDFRIINASEYIHNVPYNNQLHKNKLSNVNNQ